MTLPTLPDPALLGFKAWLTGDQFVDRPYSDATLNRYVRSARYFIEFCQQEGLRELDDANAAWIRKYLYSSTSDGIKRFSASTRIVMQSALNLLFIWAGQHDYALDNPMDRLHAERAKDRQLIGRGGRKPKRLPKVLSWEDQADLLAIASANPREFTGARDTCLIALALATGLRREELCVLRLADLSCGQLRVIGKGNKERLVRFDHSEIEAELQAWLSVRGERQEPWLFVTRTGRPMTPNLVYQQVANYLGQLERESGRSLPAKGPHLLRHTSASAQLAKGVPITQVMANMGHESLATLQVYAHLLSPRSQPS